ncbi:MAG: hypothetical protein FWC73_13085 [Defluviitaleaceae bacterium]|nr:hypothetical protein [Defluviitaleaceae bacterium]
MNFWLAIVIILVAGIGTEFVLRIVKMWFKHCENLERIKRGYPTIDGARPRDYVEPEHEESFTRMQ